ncbi:unnamed protein product [Cuscuta epithymum]|uniref:Uncharacterized protein n=1 Tax=Cuscuta epithymum TaxID=186058 RepID=A0AAV0G7Z1_9ASTE|nr:unnamed protein product [Cuscuta epithymum]
MNRRLRSGNGQSSGNREEDRIIGEKKKSSTKEKGRRVSGVKGTTSGRGKEEEELSDDVELEDMGTVGFGEERKNAVILKQVRKISKENAKIMAELKEVSKNQKSQDKKLGEILSQLRKMTTKQEGQGEEIRDEVHGPEKNTNVVLQHNQQEKSAKADLVETEHDEGVEMPNFNIFGAETQQKMCDERQEDVSEANREEKEDGVVDDKEGEEADGERKEAEADKCDDGKQLGDDVEICDTENQNEKGEAKEISEVKTTDFWEVEDTQFVKELIRNVDTVEKQVLGTDASKGTRAMRSTSDEVHEILVEHTRAKRVARSPDRYTPAEQGEARKRRRKVIAKKGKTSAFSSQKIMVHLERIQVSHHRQKK